MLTKDGKSLFPRAASAGLGIVGGSLLSTLLSAIFGIGGTIAQNQYNTPRAMRNRLKKAGLPLAYMYQGKVLGQSEVPKLSIDPTLGVAQLRRLEQEAPLVKEQTKLTGEQAEDAMLNNQVKAQFSGRKQPDGSEWNIRATRMIAEMDEKRAAAFLKNNQARLQKLFGDVQETLNDEDIPAEIKREELKKLRQAITNMGLQAGLMEQMKKIRGYDEFMNETFNESIKNAPAWMQALISWMSKVFRPVNL